MKKWIYTLPIRYKKGRKFSRPTTYLLKRASGLKIIPFQVIAVLLLNGCMMMGMKAVKTVMHQTEMPYATAVQEVNQGRALNKMILAAVLDLVNKDPAVKTIAVWKIETKTAGLDVELIRHKLIAGLVNSNRFTIVSREKLAKLLKEHNLSLSGVMDKDSAVELGHLLGVEGFVDGYAAITDNRFQLSLKLIATNTGAIVWATTVEQEI